MQVSKLQSFDYYIVKFLYLCTNKTFGHLYSNLNATQCDQMAIYMNAILPNGVRTRFAKVVPNSKKPPQELPNTLNISQKWFQNCAKSYNTELLRSF